MELHFRVILGRLLAVLAVTLVVLLGGIAAPAGASSSSSDGTTIVLAQDDDSDDESDDDEDDGGSKKRKKIFIIGGISAGTLGIGGILWRIARRRAARAAGRVAVKKVKEYRKRKNQDPGPPPYQQ